MKEEPDYCANCAAELDKMFTPSKVIESFIDQLDFYIADVEEQISGAQTAVYEAKQKRAVMAKILKEIINRPAIFDKCTSAC